MSFFMFMLQIDIILKCGANEYQADLRSKLKKDVTTGVYQGFVKFAASLEGTHTNNYSALLNY